MKKKKNLLKIFLIPILGIVLAQGMASFLMLANSGIKSSMEENIVNTDSHMVDNRRVVLENDMIEHWSSVNKESGGLTDALSGLLKQHEVGMQEFLASEELQQEYLAEVFPGMIDALQYSTTSGLYLVLANNRSVFEASDYHGFYLRDSDPQSKTNTHTDLLLEKGSKRLSQEYSISLDNAWSTDFHLDGKGNRAADDFFYVPYAAAQQHPSVDMRNLGYWSKPFILEDHTIDNHEMITYSIPLVKDGTVYGILGVEMATGYLKDYFPVKDLDANLNAGYVLALENEDGNYEELVGNGALCEAVTRDNHSFSLEEQTIDGFYKVKGAQVGKQDIYAVVKPLSLYSNNVPYKDTNWVLCGFVTEDSVYEMGKSVYRKMLLTNLISVILATILVYILVRTATKPVYRLMESVRNGVTGIHKFQTSDILEIDELHDVIEKLTDTQLQNEIQLKEEKERYRIAVESSQDMFFTYKRKEKILEIVHSNGFDGIWNCGEHPEFINNACVHPADKEQLYHVVTEAEKELNVEFRLRPTENDDYYWVNLSGSIFPDENGDRNQIVACIHNINQRKMLEEAQKNREIYDAITSFYQLHSGVEALQAAGQKEPRGTLVLVDIDSFTYISEKYGIIFGDIILEQLARLLVEQNEASDMGEVVYIRAGADQILMWFPGVEAVRAEHVMNMVRKRFQALTNEDYLALDFRCGMTQMKSLIPVQTGISQAEIALRVAKQGRLETAVYQQLPEAEQAGAPEELFEEYDSFAQLKQMNISNIAFNLFDRSGEVSVVLDILAIKLQEKYRLTNLIVTRFDREYLVSSCAYLWKNTEKYQTWNGIVHCTELEYQNFLRTENQQVVQPLTERLLRESIFGVYADGTTGLVYRMKDNGQYSGSIFFMGVDPGLLKEETGRKHFDELISIIQNRINLQRHDLSAQAKSDFLARMSHEIRTPMNGIIGMTEIALRDGQTEERRVECLRKIDSASNYLLGILNDILDMSKIESGKMHLVEKECNLSEMIQNLEAILESKLTERNLHFTKRISLEHIWFRCDSLRLKQVMVNLLSNAVKYSNSNGDIVLTVSETAAADGYSNIYFEVKDNGIGIPKEKQQLIFQRFEQADESESARKQGTGLGLAISSRLVRMMGSDIELKSELHKGSTFSFSLKLPWLEEDVIEDTQVERPVWLGQKRILVVEDNELNMEITRTLLEEQGLLIEEAYNGEEAVHKMESSEPGYYDMILMDIMMPVMDGLEATKEIRRLDREDCKTIPIVAMSANAFDEDVQRSLASGMDGHLSKPVNIRELFEVMKKYLG